jgi:hypothetical protein
MKYEIDAPKLRKLIKQMFNIDLTGKIYLVKHDYDIPVSFERLIHADVIKRWINSDEPLYLFRIGKYEFLYQEQKGEPFIVGRFGHPYSEEEFMRVLGIESLGLSMKSLVKTYTIEKD